jgi:multidrug transporter EmrE-like cation transporter
MHASQMTSYLLILPVALLVAYSQLMLKWRAVALPPQSSLSGQISAMFADPLILSAYAAAFIASVAWLLVVTRLPLTIAFPVYIGIIFVMVVTGGHFILGESMPVTKIIAVTLILSGIVLGMSADV